MASRNLYRITKLVDESEMENKRVYSGIVRAQLSNSELILLFLNCLSLQGREKFKPLVERYAMFEYIPVDEKFLSTYGHEYAASAFGEKREPIRGARFGVTRSSRKRRPTCGHSPSPGRFGIMASLPRHSCGWRRTCADGSDADIALPR